MSNNYKKELFKFIFPAVCAVIILGMFCYAWHKQNIDYYSIDNPLYQNLRDCPAYVKYGFDPKMLEKTSSEIISEIKTGKWASFTSTGRRIRNSSLDLPKRTYLSPFGNEAEEFTLVIPVEMDGEVLKFLMENNSILPGIYFAGIGENWEIFFNGKLILSEMHFNEKGRIKANRKWRDVYFPVDRSFIVHGTNILTLRIAGDPNYQGTGPFYATAPIYMDNFWTIEKRQNNDLVKVLCGVFCIIGIYYLMLFFSVRRKEEIYNLYYGLFSILLCIFSISRYSWVNSFIPDSNISIRVEFISCALMVLAFCMFIETLGRKKITKITWGYAIFCFFFTLSQIFFCAQFGEEIIVIWNTFFLAYFTYVLFYDIFYFFYWDKNGPRGKSTDGFSDVPIINILAASTLFIYVCGLYDVFVALYLKNTANQFLYGTFVVQIAMAFSLSLRFSRIYKRLEKSNIILENAVNERTLELKKQTEIAIQASREKSQFLATISHEIRTPLNAVIGLSEIMLNRNKLLPECRNDIHQIHQSGLSLLEIINDILDISKIEAGGLDIVPVEYETAPFIEDAVSLNRVRIGSNPIAFVLEIGDDFPGKLLGDEHRIKQILNNILSNAIKYTREGSVTLTVAWANIPKMDGKDDSIQKALISFKVRDTGIGIRQKDIGKLFSYYTQLDAKVNRNIEGTGLGLVITKKLVEMMGGTINVESEYGKGSVFTVTIVQGIPGMAADQCIGKEIAENLKSFRPVSPVKEKKFEYSWMPYGRVLVVDDMPVNISVIMGLLEPYGIMVDIALSGQEAIEKVRSSHSLYDLVFMDHMMPGMDGIEAVAEIRAWENEQSEEGARQKAGSGKQVPIIALTANALAGNVEMFLAKGFNGFISKPIDAVQLDNVLNLWIRDKQNPETLRYVEAQKEWRRNERSAGSPSTIQSTSPASQFTLPVISGLDVKRGIALTGGKLDIYCDVLLTFCNDVEERLPVLQTIPDENSLKNFTIQIHALKSASASIAATEVSAQAAQIEAAGRDGNFSFIENQLPGFTGQLLELVKNINAELGS